MRIIGMRHLNSMPGTLLENLSLRIDHGMMSLIYVREAVDVCQRGRLKRCFNYIMRRQKDNGLMIYTGWRQTISGILRWNY